MSTAATRALSLSLNKEVVKADVTVLRESLNTFENENVVDDADADVGGVKNVSDVVKDNEAFAAAVVVVVDVVDVNNNVDVVVCVDSNDDETSLAAFVKILFIAGDVVEGNCVGSAKVVAAKVFSVIYAAYKSS